MSEAISEATGKRYGVQRVCRVWELCRTALYGRRQRAQERRGGEKPPSPSWTTRACWRPSVPT